MALRASVLAAVARGSARKAGPGAGVLERLDESECLQLIGAGRVGRLAYTGRFGPTVLPVLYKLYEGSVVFHTLADTSPKRTCGPVSRTLSTRSPSRSTSTIRKPSKGWVVLVVGSAHHVDTEAERASIINAGADPWPETESQHLVRVQPTRISGRRRRF
jgi:nitroimidazol reductase NimA-like FMN-containing flavoprotein (pyridoxamine 5'-phosphate oxidase superfamily)